MRNHVVIANGMFRSGSTFFFDLMRKSEQNICFYEPFHPKLWELSTQDHHTSLGHTVNLNPWSEYSQYMNSTQFHDYSSRLPVYIVQNMGYYHPIVCDSNVLGYLNSLGAIAASQDKNVFGCFNRLGFAIQEAVQKPSLTDCIVVHTKRPSLQIARSFKKLYSSIRPFNLFERCFRDPWGISLLFHHHYTAYSSLFHHDSIPSSMFCFLAKLCYVNTVINQNMQAICHYSFDISRSMEVYRSECVKLLLQLGSDPSGSQSIKFLERQFSQDKSPGAIGSTNFDKLELHLLESVGFGEFL